MTSHPPRPNITENVVRTLVLYSVAEFQLGHAQNIRVRAEGHAFNVEDDGRGHAIGRTVEGAPYLDFIYTHLEYPFGVYQSRPIQLQGLGMSLLNSLCAELTVTVVKKAASLRMRFQSGRLVDHEFSEVGSEVTGNSISGVTDAKVESELLQESSLRAWLGTLLTASPSLRLSFNGQQLEASLHGAA